MRTASDPIATWSSISPAEDNVNVETPKEYQPKAVAWQIQTEHWLQPCSDCSKLNGYEFLSGFSMLLEQEFKLNEHYRESLRFLMKASEVGSCLVQCPLYGSQLYNNNSHSVSVTGIIGY